MAVLIRRGSKPGITRSKLCDGPLKSLVFTGDINVIVYGCKDGRVGLWHTNTATSPSLTTIQGGVSELALSSDKRYLAVGGNSGSLLLVDLDSGIIAACLGHSGRISAIAPLIGAGLFASADLNGNIRIWDQPLALGRVAYTAPSRLIDVQFLGNSSELAITSVDTAIRFVMDKSTQTVATHEPNNIFIAAAPNRTHFASYGSQTTIEIWSSIHHSIEHVLDTDHSRTVQLNFLSPDEIVYANNGGHVLTWSASAGVVPLAHFNQSVSSFVVLDNSILLVELHDGNLWQVERLKTSVRIRRRQSPPAHLVSITHDRRWLVVTSDRGDATIYNTSNWDAMLSFHGAGPVHHAAVSPNGDTIAIVMKSGETHLGNNYAPKYLHDGSHINWQHFSGRPRFIAFSPSGDLMMITTGDGVVWFYSMEIAQWIYFPTGSSGLTVLRVSGDGLRAATVESNGKIIVLDLELVRQTFINLSNQAPHTDF